MLLSIRLSVSSHYIELTLQHDVNLSVSSYLCVARAYYVVMIPKYLATSFAQILYMQLMRVMFYRDVIYVFIHICL